MKKLIAMISAIAVICTMSLTSFAAIEVTPNAEVTGVALAPGESGYNASYTSDDVNTQTTILAVKGATIDTNSIQYINQLTQDSETTINFDLKDTLAVGETVTVYMGGDKIARKTLGTIANVADAGGEEGGEDTEYTYDVAIQNVNYNGIAATVARITGLDPAAVAVTVDGTVAKSYVRTTDSEDVIVACIAGTYTDVDAVKALVSITEGTTDAIVYGDCDYVSSTGNYGTGSLNSADATEIDFAVVGMVTTGRGARTYTLPTDLMTLLRMDVTADGSINAADALEIDYSVVGMVTTGRGAKAYSIPAMGCYNK